ncbi:MAG: kinesin-like nuclear fusion protein [Chaenotheca gracillima]|nr:MAG: kinesin-like nuclear fusion protein [Chaenotheca gracillima]
MMPPPEPVNLKHKVSSLTEPAAKRQTLAERAGEASRMNPPSTSRHAGPPIKATSLAATRTSSLASSTSSRNFSNSTRTTSGSSFSSSTGYGSRPPSAMKQRPQTAMDRSRSGSASSKTLVPASRPASSLDEQSATDDASAIGKRKGMAPFSSSKFPIASAPRSNTMSSLKSRAARGRLPAAWMDSIAEPAGLVATDPVRDLSLDSSMHGLSLSSSRSSQNTDTTPASTTPSHIPQPKLRPVAAASFNVTPSKSPKRSSSPQKAPFLTRESNLLAWDTKGRLEDMEHLYSELRGKMDGSMKERDGLEETVEVYKARITELEIARADLSANTTTLKSELDSTKQQLSSTNITLEDERRRHRLESEDVVRGSRNELDSVQRRARDDADDAKRSHREELRELEQRLRDELEEEKRSRVREVQEATTQSSLSKQNADVEIDRKDREMRKVEEELEEVRGHLDQEKALNKTLRGSLAESSGTIVTLESTLRSLKSRVDFLESDTKSQAQSFVAMDQKLQDAIERADEANEKLRKEESLRRKLHNQVQELKGNIRVFCRIRPLLETDSANDQAKICYPDSDKESKELELTGAEEKSSLGNITAKKNAFSFDHVFRPDSQNQAVFEEISQLVQSALDGYNVCIFCYGQTGSGKTYTMSAEDGMIPRAVHQIYETAQSLEPKGWKYSMEGSFLEVYNENLNDLLGKPEEFDRKKHEIRHDTQKCKTTVSELTTVVLDCPTKVESILRRATSNRSVAATKANERSSRSHSVFILRLTGENSLTGERSEGTLNLVDLAGSERLSQSGATGDRLKETQNINKSLSCLGDVIGALGQGKDGGHVPYRNSKLTYLLQYSLGGNSKTLMFVMASPLQAHLSETITSLKFATKVHNTHIGTARRQAKTRES